MSVAVLAGGVGAARLLAGMVRVVDEAEVTVIANTGDDLVLHGLHISPDLDTIVYTLAGEVDAARGWGLSGESWQAMEVLRRYGGADWFNLGDRDLGTHLYRTQRLAEGATLSEVTAEIAAAWGLRLRLLPVTEDPLRTMVTLVDEGEVAFQHYFVRRGHDVTVTAVRFEGSERAAAGPGVVEAILGAERVVIAPSNPIVSIGPLLAVEGVADALRERRREVVAVSPIVAGAALKGPAARMMAELGHEPSVAGVARLYRELAATLVIDRADAASGPLIEVEGMSWVAAAAVMRDPAGAAKLAEVVLSPSGSA